MKTLNQNFTAQLSGKTSAPVTLAVFHFAAGDVFVSDRTITAGDGGPEFVGLVTSWGEISTKPGRGLFTIALPELTVELANGGSPLFSTYLDNGAEDTCVELFLWFKGLSYVDKEPIGRFVVAAPVEYTETGIKLTLKSAFTKSNLVAGSVISRETYPEADPDAIGRIESIVYGSPKNVLCQPVVAGAVSTLTADITASQITGIELSITPNETPLPASGTLQAGGEKLSYTAISNRVLSGVTRGVSGTAAAAHKKGAKIFEVRADFTYLAAGHPVKSIGDVYVGGVRVVSGVTKNTSASGKATIVFSDKFTLEKSVDLGVSQGSHSHINPTWSGAGANTSYYPSLPQWTAAVNPNWTQDIHKGKAFRDGSSIVIGSDNNNYVCILAHTSSAANKPVTGSNWQTYWALDASGVTGVTWLSGQNYGTGGNYFYITDNGSNYLNLRSINGALLNVGAFTGTVVIAETQVIHQDTYVSSDGGAPSLGEATALCDGNFNKWCTVYSPQTITTQRTMTVGDKGVIIAANICSMRGNALYSAYGRSTILGGKFAGQYSDGGGTATQAFRTLLSTYNAAVGWSDFEGMQIQASADTGLNAYCSEHWIEVVYVPYSGGSSPATGVALTGNSTADIVVGGRVTCDIEGYQDDSSGTYTGTPYALIENPADVMRHFMLNYMAMTEVEFDQSYVDARQDISQAISDGYLFAGVISSPVEAFGLLESWSRQSRLKISHDGYKAKLRFIGNVPGAADKVLDKSAIKKGSFRLARTGKEEVINRLDIHYNRDFSSANGYMAIAGSSQSYPPDGDPASIAAYGPRSPRSPFLFGFVANDAMASDLRDFFITRFKDIRRRVSMTLLLGNFGLEEGDIVEISFPSPAFGVSGTLFYVEDVAMTPGSALKGRADEIHIQAREVAP